MCSYALSSTYCLRQSCNILSYACVIVKKFFIFFSKNFSAHWSSFVLHRLLCYSFFYASSTAAFIFCTYSFTYGTQSAPCSATILTIADPTIAPSENAAISFACSGIEIPNPTAHGISVTSLTLPIISPILVVISLRTPVTPREETQ